MALVDLTDQQFNQQVLQARQLVLVDFWAPWCAPCLAMAPVLKQLAEEYGDKLKVCKINIDENQTMATKYQVLSIPTLLLFKQGQVVKQLVGARTASDIKKTIEQSIS